LRAIIARTLIFAAVSALLLLAFCSPWHSGNIDRFITPMDFLLCVATQTSVPLMGWIASEVFSGSKTTRTVLAFLWTCVGTYGLVLLSDRFHDSSVYHPPKPWDPVFNEGGIIFYLVLIPLLSLIAGLISYFEFNQTRHG
jgi:hypothetical protein